MSKPLSSGHIWAMPIVLAVSSGVGLVSALLGDGIWDSLSCLALSAPVAVIIWYVTRPIRVT